MRRERRRETRCAGAGLLTSLFWLLLEKGINLCNLVAGTETSNQKKHLSVLKQRLGGVCMWCSIAVQRWSRAAACAYRFEAVCTKPERLVPCVPGCWQF